MAARVNKLLRNKFRKKRFASPLLIDEDVVDALLLWKFGGDSSVPTFYENDRDSNIISPEGEEWLLANKALADHFLNESEKTNPSIISGDRYTRLFDDDLKRNACYPIWPRQASGIVPLLLWAWAWYYKDSMVWAWRFFWFLVISHSIEAVLVYVWLIPTGFSMMASMSWSYYAFWCGWPITGKASILSGIRLKKLENLEKLKLKEREKMESKLKASNSKNKKE